MGALTRCGRTLAISLATVLAIIDLTHGFTLRYEFVRPHDLAAEESSVHEVRHELKRDTDVIDEGDEFSVAPVIPIQTPVAMPLISTTEMAEPTTDKETHVTIALTEKSNENTSDMLVTTAIPNEEDTTTSTASENETTESTLNKQLNRVYNTSPATITLKEATTVKISIGVTNVEATANEEKNETNDINTNKISPVISTTVSTLIKETQKRSHNIINITAESTESSSVGTIPGWKKYTRIERKPVNITDETPLKSERLGDSLNAHTTVRHVSLEKAFNLAPDIPSLQELRTHLMDSTNSIQTGNDIEKTTDATETLTNYDQSKTKEESKTIEINPTEMVSLRAGYLDHTKSSIGATGNRSKAGNEIEVDGVTYQMEIHDENDDIQNMTSHSQMVEDALKEEFLVEARLDDIRFLTTSSSSRSKNVEQNEVTDTPQSMQGDQTTKQTQSDDLTVKPIKSLYTVNPNYKPLKKIDVQPLKPFMRDPDDNSWRNESLSSLGIVFKGKNSSKAFTEVLKNKTEIVMSNLTELKNKTIEKVELRDRLEKIAEKRKPKKKKTDTFGKTEYNDYEENNSGDTHLSKEKTSDISEILTTSPSPPILTKIVEWASKGPVIEEGLSKTAKAATPAQTAHDYYDTKDEDTDYATFPNIDILKSTPRPRVQWPVTQKILDDTKPTRNLMADRQPTVQYFPPRPNKGENHSKYHDEFRHKFNIYGKKLEPKTNVEPTVTYTEKNYHEKYPTARYFSGENRERTSDENKNPTIQPIQHVEYRPVEETEDRAFVFRHYKDLLESLIKDTDYERNANAYHQAPAGGAADDEGKTVKSEEYDYVQRKENLNRFVDTFDENHVRFKADFPILFNTSIVHGSESGKVLASSSAMFKRLYSSGAQGGGEPVFSNRPYDPGCENMTVELTPAYELHYYVPEQEETADQPMPYGYRT